MFSEGIQEEVRVGDLEKVISVDINIIADNYERFRAQR